MADDPNLTKVRFHLEQDDDGWPPVTSEGLWATGLGHDLYRLDNIPWLVRGVACDDVFRAEADGDGVMWARDRVQASGNCTIRVVPLGEDARQDWRVVLDVLTALGADGEGAGPAYNLVAFNVPPSAQLAKIKSRLRQGEAAGEWGYEEGCVTEAWLAL